MPDQDDASADRDVAEHVDTSPLVLVVDDTEDTRSLYALAFEEAGFRVEQASNGLEALEKIANTKPALVLLDLSMPVMDGWEATRRIKAEPSTADIIVIAVTGHGTQLGHQMAVDAGADFVLAKPCLPDDVLACARHQLALRASKKQ